MYLHPVNELNGLAPKHQTIPRSVIYQCNECPSVFTQEKDLLEHLNVHSASPDRQCRHCLKTFTRKSSLKNHLKARVCQQQQTAAGHQSMDAQSLNPQTLVFPSSSSSYERCTRSPKNGSVADQNSLNQNNALPIATTTASQLINFSLDQYQFQLQNYQAASKLLPPAAAASSKHEPVSLKTTSHPNDLKYQYQCSICSKGYSSLADLYEHYQCIHNRCHLCNSFFKTYADLVDHRKRVHQTKTPSSSSSSLSTTLHQLTSSSSSSLPLVSVNAESATSSSSSSVVKPYHCAVCSKNFKLKSSLQRHSLLHYGPKKYQCSHCHRAFTTKSHLIDHNQRSHSALRTHHCTHCSMAFLRNGDLKEHLRTHSTERPFQCALCAKTFKHMKNLRYHLKKVHQTLNFGYSLVIGDTVG
ncbi:hypothetical protein TYRP_007623 [Tyrophagus putrescentiae]|nr:hypothetical protein TYRP_007623 [Tyrophagus putrescentiae]